MRDHCFVIGCPRSGTTALVHLLHSHPALAIGMERYKYFVKQMRRTRNATLLTPAHFEPDRLFEFHPSETNHIPPTFGDHYDVIRCRFASGLVQWVGDKVLPINEWTARALAHQFPRARFIFIYRDLLRVASSYDKRARDPRDTAWPPANDHELALRQWGEAFRAVDELLALMPTDRVFVVRYERLFAGCAATCRALFRFLGLSTTASVEQCFAGLCADWPARQAKPLVLTPQEQESLLRRVDAGLSARFDQRFEAQLAPAPPAVCSSPARAFDERLAVRLELGFGG